MNLSINNETAALQSVILGIGTDRGTPRGINPMMRKHQQNDTFPTTEDICEEIRTFEAVLLQNHVEVHRPRNLNATEQIFARDIGFVIEDYFFIAGMKHPVRKQEIEGIHHILQAIPNNQIIDIPDHILVEGGDVVLWNEYIFLGLGARTNRDGLDFLKNFFPKKTVIGFELVVDQNNANRHILHLDCTFQPIGTDEAIIYYDGFKTAPEVLLDLFPKEKRIAVSQQEKNRMFPNIFSISPQKIVIEQKFERLSHELHQRGYTVFKVKYSETSKLSGLLRCSTLPLRRA